jgi:hypothetical protein
MPNFPEMLMLKPKPYDYTLKELREQTQIQQDALNEQQRQSEIMEEWRKTMERQTQIL